jgi:hypothetical protein
MAPEHGIRIDGTLKPRSKFLGNSAASMMEGIAVMKFLNTGERLLGNPYRFIKEEVLIRTVSLPSQTCTHAEFCSAK